MNRVMTFVGSSIAVALVFLLLIWALQRRMIYFPAADVPPPGDVSLSHVVPVTFSTTDGLTLNAWFVPASAKPARGTVVVFSGNAGNRAYRAPLALALSARGLHVLLVDYRGYGGNPGSPTESGLFADSRAARMYLATHGDVDLSRVIYFGESLGTAVATELAAEHPPLALILRSPFTSMADIGQHHYPALPVRRLLRDRFAAIDHIRHVRVPLLVIAGGRDRIVPIEYSRRLFDAANHSKSMVVIDDADHNDYELLAGDAMIDAIARFLEPLL
jgi:fermentation-respiration switch protein FrsA (DUF1100 family)